jgi:hypothetical protein
MNSLGIIAARKILLSMSYRGHHTKRQKSYAKPSLRKPVANGKAIATAFCNSNRWALALSENRCINVPMPLKNSLPEAFSALILVFSNQDGEYLWLPLLLSRALSAV